MKRRELIALAGGAAAWPIVGRAQQGAMPVVGFLSAGGPPTPGELADFNKGLATLGFIEGRSVGIVIRSADRYDNLVTLIAEFLRLPVAAIYASGSADAALAAKAATSKTPIVFSNGGDPVRLGLVASINRPGENITGMTYFSGILAPKRLELLRELVPGVDVIAFLVNPANGRAAADVSEMETAAHIINQQVMVIRASNAAEIDAAFAMMAERRIGALLIAGDAFFTRKPDQIIALALRYRIPVSHPSRSSVDAGGLMSYGDNRSESIRQAGIYVGRILKGEKPSDLPVMQPTKFEFVLNLKTAKILDLKISPQLLAIADEVIE